MQRKSMKLAASIFHLLTVSDRGSCIPPPTKSKSLQTFKFKSNLQSQFTLKSTFTQNHGMTKVEGTLKGP